MNWNITGFFTVFCHTLHIYYTVNVLLLHLVLSWNPHLHLIQLLIRNMHQDNIIIHKGASHKNVKRLTTSKSTEKIQNYIFVIKKIKLNCHDNNVKNASFFMLNIIDSFLLFWQNKNMWDSPLNSVQLWFALLSNYIKLLSKVL